METAGGMTRTNNRISIVTAKLFEADRLSEVFNGCCGVFHTAAFIDPAGLSGYSVSLGLLLVVFSSASNLRTINSHIFCLRPSFIALLWGLPLFDLTIRRLFFISSPTLLLNIVILHIM